jgi:hypothetical protein
LKVFAARSSTVLGWVINLRQPNMLRLIMTSTLTLTLGLVAVPALAITVKATGEIETVTSWRHDACTKTDVPDTPARAFRDVNGNIHLIASHSTARALVGPSLDTANAGGTSVPQASTCTAGVIASQQRFRRMAV